VTIREIQPGDTALAFEAMRALRTQLTDAATFAEVIDREQRPRGYRLLGAFEQGVPEPAAVAGFRIARSIAWGRYLYVDDLSTLPTTRRRGHARRLLEWLLEEAARDQCDQFHLDSGVGPERTDAHRLYLNVGLQITAHHFARVI
jgi:GNAT superfamily N-acetyltransferase